ncbi:hypothetical protein GCM10008179_24830 [Hansschlegelia plantiphila]|uniref:LysR substrate-binding domain-containing protein n=2 Tax=Hansschlegelia plantiphila TaxID=374655 RepID=A0A9W6MWH1_9HYPH|nr:hypothetical protein GCM10008179_24830 [Hansschlegelia plantiphila]
MITLTEEGERLLGHARLILEDIALAEADLAKRRDAPEGLVRVGVTTALGLFISRTLLGELYERYPLLQVELLMSDWHGSMIEEGLDAAFRIGHVAEDHLIQRRICDITRVLVAAPSYLAERGPAARAEDLSGHELIGYGYDRDPVTWSVDGLTVRVEGRFKSNSSALAHQAALAGLGIGLLPAFQVHDDLSHGRLSPVLPASTIAPLHLSIVYRPGRRLPPRTRMFIEFSKEKLELLVGA